MTQLGHHSTKVVMGDTRASERGCVPVKLYSQKQAAARLRPRPLSADFCAVEL